jgi:hypothetical protein
MKTARPLNDPAGKRQPSPYEVLQAFFERYDLRECQSELWRLLGASFSSEDADLWNRLDRANAVFFCKGIDDVLRALFEIKDEIQNRYEGSENP